MQTYVVAAKKEVCIDCWAGWLNMSDACDRRVHRQDRIAKPGRFGLHGLWGRREGTEPAQVGMWKGRHAGNQAQASPSHYLAQNRRTQREGCQEATEVVFTPVCLWQSAQTQFTTPSHAGAGSANLTNETSTFSVVTFRVLCVLEYFFVTDSIHRLLCKISKGLTYALETQIRLNLLKARSAV